MVHYTIYGFFFLILLKIKVKKVQAHEMLYTCIKFLEEIEVY